MGKIIYGNEVAKTVKDDLKKDLDRLKKEGKRLPKLVVVLVGNNVASVSYVTGKEKACKEIGMENELLRFEENIREEKLLEVVENLNKDDSVDGILVQLPLPKHIDESKVLQAIDPEKDVDGFHPVNVGKLLLQEDGFLSCTPKGILRLLESIGLSDLSGKKAVVIGRSNIVGKPVAQLLLNKHATVTICHSRTEHIEEITSQADILIVSVGSPRLVKANWIKEGAIVIDVGINRDEHNKLCGDVDFQEVEPKTSYITPVPKGVGPMTIAMLLENTWESYYKREGKKQEM
ncbi:bifunctional methylenetetrahydrofolate dehydrogenase/methenyltetrahydrofolate cyclohydrolase FolD [Amedibacterium intestinale]|uniref:bifunctional methylenetetrahydrofolate dehydrogenase/methenyltetrahydrofolate cyclohydrolase FolD n=1 Tax=Amedibacterium intestinale TaxID=2583452 RepID=UPI000E544863|nr:bifunctional methylenetetrahydrofolate dehydrogenase/methenyltetrahydrofolate cyclohydrolase FolD [Amedibacterium intestinale]RHO22725.1 bifunctional methylenetetrahydrofolate dehydrogenase/methenyltetrahydrofolate cyclohydrolase FolD [Eubacterium sp. AM18-26]RHO27181.1 bifunctional methylenetetrahydrofolate dehydrogenase/methenyltetrahydrofolate cyclohydrolase FolD [Eubacterium sp. AM18-10LB-B]RHO31081.1 bifunctional methylenetetrahydrofolate dehydrogenase/methenyltetrahydrofolate cyclohydro